jgi:hypothetical protein
VVALKWEDIDPTGRSIMGKSHTHLLCFCWFSSSPLIFGLVAVFAAAEEEEAVGGGF